MSKMLRLLIEAMPCTNELIYLVWSPCAADLCSVKVSVPGPVINTLSVVFIVDYSNHISCVLNRLLAMLWLQTITTPAALGSSFSSTIWRTASSEGTAAWSVFITSPPHPRNFCWHSFFACFCRATVEKYLLEKSRLVSRHKRER